MKEQRRSKTCIAKRKESWYKDRDFLQLLSMISIPTLLVFIFNYIPMYGVIIAFKNYKYNLGIFGSAWSGWKNFASFVTSQHFPVLLKNTLVNNALFIAFGVMAALVVAILLHEVTSRTRTKIFQTILILPNFVSWVLVSFLLYIFLAPNTGVLPVIFRHLGLREISWYSTPNAWPIILTIVFIWKNVGMDSVVYYAALMGMDNSLIEAAAVDGANKWQIIKNIILPTLKPLVIMLTIMKIGNIFRADFGLFYNVPRDVGVLYEWTDVFDTYIFRMTRVDGNFSIAAAAGLMQSVVGFICVVITNKISKKIDPDSGIF